MLGACRLGQLADSVYPALNASYGYDNADRITAVSRSGDNQAFAWDAVGNRTSHQRAGSADTYAPVA